MIHLSKSIDQVQRAEILMPEFGWEGSVSEVLSSGRYTHLGAVVFESPRTGAWLGTKLTAAARYVGADVKSCIWILTTQTTAPASVMTYQRSSNGKTGHRVEDIDDAAADVAGAIASAARSTIPLRLFGRLLGEPLPDGEIRLRSPTVNLQSFGPAIDAVGGRISADQAGPYAVIPRNYLSKMLLMDEEDQSQVNQTIFRRRYLGLVEDITRNHVVGPLFEASCEETQIPILPPEAVNRSRLFLLEVGGMRYIGVTVGSGDRAVRNAKIMTIRNAAQLGVDFPDPDDPDYVPQVWGLMSALRDPTTLFPDLHMHGGVAVYPGDVAEAIQAEIAVLVASGRKKDRCEIA